MIPDILPYVKSGGTINMEEIFVLLMNDSSRSSGRLSSQKIGYMPQIESNI